MKKQLRRIFVLALAVTTVWIGGLAADSARLRNELLRLHVVGASDAAEDQQVKLRVRDAVLETLRQGLQDVQDVDQAVEYVQTMLPKLEQTANRVLEECGFSQTVTLSVGEEAFPARDYETFRLPSGIYKALRIVIGEGEGQNWWCVVFPELCMGATTEQFVETASMEGFDPQLCAALTGEYEIRFWVLDQLGRLGNFLHRDSE